MDAGTYNVRKATCGLYCQSCDGVTTWSMVANPYALTVSGQRQQSLYGTWNTGSQYDYSTYSDWSTSNSAVATVGTSRVTGQTPGLASGVSPGSANITARDAFTNSPDYTSNWCSGSPWSCPLLYGGSAASSGTVAPKVSITGPITVPLLAAGAAGRNSIGLGATGTPSGGTYLWSLSSGSGIVSLSNTTASTVTVTSQAVGTATVQVKYTYNSQNATASKNVTVQKPTRLSIVSGTSVAVPEAGCSPPNNACGMNRQFQYQVLDQSGAPIAAAGMQFWDKIFTSSPNTCSLTSYSTTCTAYGIPNGGPCGPQTDSSGQFIETLTICSTQCRSGPFCITGCSTGSNQTWNVNGFSLTADVKALSYQCNYVYVNSQ